jgi:hypothetical protein
VQPASALTKPSADVGHRNCIDGASNLADWTGHTEQPAEDDRLQHAVSRLRSIRMHQWIASPFVPDWCYETTAEFHIASQLNV